MGSRGTKGSRGNRRGKITDPVACGLNPAWTFDNFAVGPCNLLAVQAAKSFLRNHHYSKYHYITGEAGSGKTHLAHAMGNEFLRRHPKKRIAYTSWNQLIKVIEMTRDGIKGYSFISHFSSYSFVIVEVSADSNDIDIFPSIISRLLDFGCKIVLVARTRIFDSLTQLKADLESVYGVPLATESHLDPLDKETRRQLVLLSAKETGQNLPEAYIKKLAKEDIDASETLKSVTSLTEILDRYKPSFSQFELEENFQTSLAYLTDEEIKRLKKSIADSKKMMDVVSKIVNS